MAWVVDSTHASIGFAVKHMVIATVKGRFAKFEVDADMDEAHPERSTVTVRIDAASIDTNESQRDAHLRSPDFLHVEQFPLITFQSRRIERVGPNGDYRIIGDLTIRDVTREVTLNADFGLAKDPWGNQRAGLSAEISISRKDFGLTWNVPLEAGGWLVGDNVRISLDFELVKKD